jgi:hypothetical protein
MTEKISLHLAPTRDVTDLPKIGIRRIRILYEKSVGFRNNIARLTNSQLEIFVANVDRNSLKQVNSKI